MLCFIVTADDNVLTIFLVQFVCESFVSGGLFLDLERSGSA